MCKLWFGPQNEVPKSILDKLALGANLAKNVFCTSPWGAPPWLTPLGTPQGTPLGTLSRLESKVTHTPLPLGANYAETDCLYCDAQTKFQQS